MLNSAKISAATEKDIPELMSLALVCGLSFWPAEGYLRSISDPDNVVLCLRYAGKICGFLVGRISLQIKMPAEIYNLGVHPTFRGRGYADLLVREFLERCIETDSSEIWLEVRASNTAAIHLYEKQGFSVTALRPSFYKDPAEDAMLMTRVIKQTV